MTLADSGDARKTAASATSSAVMSRRSGARSAAWSAIEPKPGMPRAASVRTGPAEIALTRMPASPRSHAR